MAAAPCEWRWHLVDGNGTQRNTMTLCVMHRQGLDVGVCHRQTPATIDLSTSGRITGGWRRQLRREIPEQMRTA